MLGLRSAQIILYVQSMSKSLAFYRDELGLKVTFPTWETDLAAEPWVTLDAGSTSIALHSGGKGRLGEGSPALSLIVDDVVGAKAHLEAQGVSVSEIQEPHPGVKVCDTRDPDGTVVFLKQG